MVVPGIARRITNRMLQEGVIGEDERDYCQYGMEITIANTVNLLVTMLVAILFREFLGMLIFYLVFVVTRSYCGGYHADSYAKCFTFFLVLNVCTGWLLRYSNIDISVWKIVLIGITLVYAILVYFWAPMENPAKPLTAEEKKRYHTICIISFPVLFWAGLFVYEIFPICGKAITCGVVCVCLLMLLQLGRSVYSFVFIKENSTTC